MKRRFVAPAALYLLSAGLAAGEVRSTQLEEVVVTATPFSDAISETMLPVGILTGEELRRKVAGSLGATLDEEPGVHSASFGSGVGHPVIRGQSGKRVQILQSGLEVGDASNISPDHGIGVEPLLADRIEVLRGPSTLLYGNGAIGGVVNVVDSRIPQSTDSEHWLIAEQTFDSVSDEYRTLVRLDGASGNIAFHVDGVTRNNDNIEIPGFATDNGTADNTFGFIGNSNGSGDSIHGGISRIGDAGFVGLSVGEIRTDYGLPPGVHDHHHEDHGGDEVAIRLDMEQLRYDLRGRHDFGGGLFNSIEGHLGYSDYEHREVEIEGDQREIGTTWTNRASNARVTASHASIGNWTGVWGVQLGNSEFGAIGDEAFIPVSDIDSAALFVVERLEGERIDWEFGARFERGSIDPAGACESKASSASLSASLQYRLGNRSKVLVALSRSERTPTVEERYSNITGTNCARPTDDADLVLHAATGLLEVGDPELDNETATNIELGFRRSRGALRGQLNVYYNAIDRYIHLRDDGRIKDEPIAVYSARNATFRGVEATLDYTLFESRDAGLVDVSLFGDLVRARFDGGENVPRIPPARIGAGLGWQRSAWSMGLRIAHAFDQNRVALGETATDGYTLASFDADYRWTFDAGAEFLVFFRGDNLLNEEIRNHVSLLKSVAPEPGRGFRIGMRLTY